MFCADKEGVKKKEWRARCIPCSEVTGAPILVYDTRDSKKKHCGYRKFKGKTGEWLKTCPHNTNLERQAKRVALELVRVPTGLTGCLLGAWASSIIPEG